MHANPLILTNSSRLRPSHKASSLRITVVFLLLSLVSLKLFWNIEIVPKTGAKEALLIAARYGLPGSTLCKSIWHSFSKTRRCAFLLTTQNAISSWASASDPCTAVIHRCNTIASLLHARRIPFSSNGNVVESELCMCAWKEKRTLAPPNEFDRVVMDCHTLQNV